MSKRLDFYEKEDFFSYKRRKLAAGFEILSISEIYKRIGNDKNPDYKTLFDNANTIIDISVLTEFANYELLAEQTINYLPDEVVFICEESKRVLLEYKLRFIFDDFKIIDDSEIYRDTKDQGNLSKKLHRKIIDLSEEELNEFFKKFSCRLYGHPKFKDDFRQQIESFRLFNKLKEHKVLSVFLLGDSGVGKTEVARAVFECLGGEKSLAKINFGNYSNEFSLSSLIGAARGYIGSDDGEVFMKVRNTDVGVLLIDEFEKSNVALFNYFLGVLESGKMTSSLGDEMDLNGFIIIFTSNIKKEEFKKRISPELRSRFDYKGRFLLLEDADKKKYLIFRSNDIAQKVKVEFKMGVKEELEKYLLRNINVSAFKNMRDINKQIKKKFLQFFKEYRKDQVATAKPFDFFNRLKNLKI